MIRTTRSGAEILQRFQIHADRWVVLCSHDTAYGVWSMDDDGFCSRGEIRSTLHTATQCYVERIKREMHQVWEQRIRSPGSLR